MQVTEARVKFNANYNSRTPERKKSEMKDRIMLASNPCQRSYFQTKSMSTDMVELEEYLRQHLLQSKNMSCGKMDQYCYYTCVYGRGCDTGMQGV
jgi:hypothetical protein